jgi:ATP-dependent DNA helicase RecQ
MSEPLKLLQKDWKHERFRTPQEAIIQSVLECKDTFALLPTGGGKSVCFQVPTLAQEGLTIVISPLIALIKDQVEGLKAKGIKAVSIVSGMTSREIDFALDNCIYDQTKFLFISPERIAAPLFQERLKKMHVSLIAIDEAHCISQWGYDFRPAYLEIAKIREWHPKIPFLAFSRRKARPAWCPGHATRTGSDGPHQMEVGGLDSPTDASA